MAWSGGMAHGGPNNPWMKLMGIVHKERTARAAHSSRHDGGDKDAENEFTLPIDIGPYAAAMACVSCRLIPIPPFYTCGSGHIFCQPCGSVNAECFLRNVQNHLCGRLIRKTRCHLYEATFNGATFACPNRIKLGCTRTYTGQQIIKDNALETCICRESEKTAEEERMEGVEDDSSDKTVILEDFHVD